MKSAKTIFGISAFAGIFVAAIVAFTPLSGVGLGSWYAGVHFLFEFAGTVIGALVGYHSFVYFKKSGFSRYLILGTVFITAAILDLLHALVFPGMPYLFLFPSTNLAVYFYFAARLLTVLGIFAAFAFIGKMKKHASALGIVVALALVVGLYTYAGLSGGNIVQFVGVSGPLMDKVTTEFVIALLFLLEGMIFWKKYRNKRMETYHLLSFFLFSALSDLTFTYYLNAYTLPVLVGHAFRTTAYVFLFLATKNFKKEAGRPETLV